MYFVKSSCSAKSKKGEKFHISVLSASEVVSFEWSNHRNFVHRLKR